MTLRYTLFYYHSWLRVGRTRGLDAYPILVHTLLESIFSALHGLGANRFFSKGRCMYVRDRQAPITVSRGPMARKKWSKTQLIFKTTGVVVRARSVQAPITPKHNQATQLSITPPADSGERALQYWRAITLVHACVGLRSTVMPQRVLKLMPLLLYVRASRFIMESSIAQLHYARLFFTVADRQFFFVKK